MILEGWHFASPAYAALSFVVIVLLAWATLARRDLWPFSHYPMFAAYRNSTGERFFELRFHLPGGRVKLLPEHAATVADDFTRAFQERWSESGADRAALREVVRRFWQKACCDEPDLAEALRIEVVLRAALIARTGTIAVAEKTILSVGAEEFSPQ